MTPTVQPVTIRPYLLQDAAATLAVFLDAVTETAAVDYSPEQIAAWSAPKDRDLAAWGRSRVELGTFVAMVDGQVAGFSDVSAEGYIHMMFVSPRFGRRGVGRALLAEAERRATSARDSALTTNASITARPFFEAAGFVVVAQQHPLTRGVRLTNYRMLRRPGHAASRD